MRSDETKKKNLLINTYLTTRLQELVKKITKEYQKNDDICGSASTAVVKQLHNGSFGVYGI